VLTRFIATGFGSGYLPFAPGTWGSIVGLLLGFYICQHTQALGLLLATLFSFGIGWFCSQRLVTLSPENRDPSYIVIDEIAGIFLTLWLALLWSSPLTLDDFLVLFFAFRLFDIIKPFPIGLIESQLEKNVTTAGFGIMIDDIIAASYAILLFICYKQLQIHHFLFN
jgi:phosphatidylglycerophosphatase A